ncbi:16S rRNA (guanine(527)-N(7))-methyltransferase RsmG [Aliidiomarina sedimenti]|uniref:Ribosomal RNA small subunit methyltransferase G n=1 Tax=Aliidiomarina sedimenti TaxID=1933879 RepID=A0ABY0C0Q2_9GAMM|nr:16S rRNA (guanine(527)-N(7))-methyltransferase RsmG [Aliidiomarina sedimenti]RUO30917.1 16S rRNA (guanine(527)-N(7))-methyltransferase RsmG [Aliidiomarina sedimenti]
MSDAAQLAQKLQQLLAKTSLAVSEAQQNQLVQLVLLLNKWNQAYNLTSVRDPQAMLIRHIMDSVVVSPYLQGERIVDVGTGPGLPGLPLAILNPDKEFVLVDSLGKRINFIRQVVHQLGLKNVTAVHSRVENYEPDQGFSSVISRAFASLADMLSWCHHLPSAEGSFIALKGQLDEDELTAVPAEFTVESKVRLNVPELEAERHLVVIRQHQ